MKSDIPTDGRTITYSKKQYRKCYQPYCHCMKPGGKLHGPYTYAYWFEDGHLKSKYIGKVEEAEIAPTSIPLTPIEREHIDALRAGIMRRAMDKIRTESEERAHERN